MLNFFKSLFSGQTEKPIENNQPQNNKKDFEILKYDGLRAQRIGHIDYAVKCFSEALALEKDFETMGYLSQVYQQIGELPKAKALLQEMINMEPHMTETLLSLSNVCFIEEDYSGMEEAAHSVLTIDKENATAYFFLGKARKGQKDDLMAIAHLTKAILFKDDFIEARLLRANILIEMQQVQEAMEDVTNILHLHPEEENALLVRARIKEINQNNEEAENDYRLITTLNPFNEEAYLQLGRMFIANKKLEEAITLFDEAIELNPNFAKGYHERGRAKLLNGDKAGSMEDMKKSLELNPKEEALLNGEFNNQQAPSTDILGL